MVLSKLENHSIRGAECFIGWNVQSVPNGLPSNRNMQCDQISYYFSTFKFNLIAWHKKHLEVRLGQVANHLQPDAILIADGVGMENPLQFVTTGLPLPKVVFRGFLNHQWHFNLEMNQKTSWEIEALNKNKALNNCSLPPQKKTWISLVKAHLVRIIPSNTNIP